MTEIEQKVRERLADLVVIEPNARMHFVEHPRVDERNSLSTENFVDTGCVPRANQKHASYPVRRERADLLQFFGLVVV